MIHSDCKVQDLFWLLKMNCQWKLSSHTYSDPVLHENHQSAILLDEKNVWKFSFRNFGFIWVAGNMVLIWLLCWSPGSQFLTAKYYLNFVAVRQPQKAKYWMLSSAFGITGSWRWLSSWREYLVFFRYAILLYYVIYLIVVQWYACCVAVLNRIMPHHAEYCTNPYEDLVPNNL